MPEKEHHLTPPIRHFLKTLRTNKNYHGDISDNYADRIINATDNSIYQVLPHAILTPKKTDDLNIILKLASAPDYKELSFIARGGGTGTNGQALNDAIVIDTSKYLNKILHIDAEKRQVHVEPGVVLDDLNHVLKPYGLWFPPHVSPSNRATIGGMVSTDACGKGSRIYGKTIDYVENLDCVLLDGSSFKTETPPENISKQIQLTLGQYPDLTKALPPLPRGHSGYNLTKGANLNAIITGSEGSLCLIKSITLNVIEKPALQALYAIPYYDFDVALRDVTNLLTLNPAAIETIDDTIIDLARSDILWSSLSAFIPSGIDSNNIRAMHFVAFDADTETALKGQTDAFEAHCEKFEQTFYSTVNAAEIRNIWALRSKCVGLLGNMTGTRRSVPFIEDIAVPPENLADFIAEFRTLLQSRGLRFGAFGHSDAGCLHVRPALDIKIPEDEALIRTLTDEVVKIIKKYDGVLWGEHGKGFRGEYTESFLGSDYYEAMQKIKAIFDPDNRLNTGKIATAFGSGLNLMRIDAPKTRGAYDRQITEDLQKEYPKAIECNGNGLCFSTLKDDTMCPSYKVTRDRRHSPKGRAALLREWLRLKSTNNEDANFTEDVLDALNGCLSCKACTSTCPIHVNIPDMKTRFLEEYHKSKRRKLRDYAIGYTEIMAYKLSKLPYPFSHITSWPLIKQCIEISTGLTDLPVPPRKSLHKAMKDHGFQFFDVSKEVVDNTVFIAQDAFTGIYDVSVTLSALKLIRKLGFEPIVLPYHQSGKSWHIRGFLKNFKRVAIENDRFFETLQKHNVPIVGIDPSVTLIYRDEYKKLGFAQNYKILMLQEWLKIVIADQDVKPAARTASLFLHCTEKTVLPSSAASWRHILQHFGIETEIKDIGCCGMAGIYGHESEHLGTSKSLYDLSWKDQIQDNALVTGYSCRCQTKRFDQFRPQHPVELIETLL